jgi:hypothetical protein
MKFPPVFSSIYFLLTYLNRKSLQLCACCAENVYSIENESTDTEAKLFYTQVGMGTDSVKAGNTQGEENDDEEDNNEAEESHASDMDQ